MLLPQPPSPSSPLRCSSEGARQQEQSLWPKPMGPRLHFSTLPRHRSSRAHTDWPRAGSTTTSPKTQVHTVSGSPSTSACPFLSSHPQQSTVRPFHHLQLESGLNKFVSRVPQKGSSSPHLVGSLEDTDPARSTGKARHQAQGQAGHHTSQGGALKPTVFHPGAFLLCPSPLSSLPLFGSPC